MAPMARHRPDRTRQRRRPGSLAAAARSGSWRRSGRRPLPSRARPRGGGRRSSAAAFVATPGPLGPVTVIGDSVLVGASYEPSLPTLLAERGWGPITYPRRSRVHGGQLPTGRERGIGGELDPRGGGRRVGPAERGRQPGQQRRRLLRPDVDCNANTIRYHARRDRPRPHRVVEHDHPESGAARRADRVQPGPRNRRCRAPVAPPVGLAGGRRRQRDRDRTRRHAPARHRQLPPPIRTDGRRHHRAAGRRDACRRRCGGAGRVGPPSEYPPLDPRSGARHPAAARGTAPAGGVQTIALRRPRPCRFTAVAVSLTSADPAAHGFLTADACGQRPDASSANYTRGGARGAFAVVPLDADGRLCVYSSAATDLIVDLQGAFVGQDAPVEEATRFTPRAPERSSTPAPPVGLRCSCWLRQPDRAVWRSTSPPPVPRRRATSRRTRAAGPCRSCRT